MKFFFFCFEALRSSFQRLSFVLPSGRCFPRFGSAVGLLASGSSCESRRFGKTASLFASGKVVSVWPLRVKPSACSVLRISAILRFSLRLCPFVLNQTLLIHSLGQRSIALLQGLGLAALAPQSVERANPSIERTRSGSAGLALISFWAKPAPPPRAAHVKR